MKCVVIINPKSGKGFSIKNENRIRQILSDYNYESKFIYTKRRGHATNIIKNVDLDVDLVISMGGDGTFSEVMNGNLKREKPLVISHLPIGTVNDIGHMYGLVNNLYTNLKLILTGEVMNVDVGLINNHAFTYVASYGKFMEIPYKTPHELKKYLGWLAYAFEVLKQIFSRIPKYSIEYSIDGEKHSGKYSFIIISNANHIAGINNFYRDMKLDDSKIEIMLCSLYKKIDIIKAFYNLKTNHLQGVSGIELYKCSNFELKLMDKVSSWCVDGEKFKDNKKTYKFTILKNIKMQLPKKNLNKLFINYEKK